MTMTYGERGSAVSPLTYGVATLGKVTVYYDLVSVAMTRL